MLVPYDLNHTPRQHAGAAPHRFVPNVAVRFWELVMSVPFGLRVPVPGPSLSGESHAHWLEQVAVWTRRVNNALTYPVEMWGRIRTGEIVPDVNFTQFCAQAYTRMHRHNLYTELAMFTLLQSGMLGLLLFKTIPGVGSEFVPVLSLANLMVSAFVAPHVRSKWATGTETL